jgi:pyruvate kinase
MHAIAPPTNPERDAPWTPPLTKILATVGPSISHPDIIQKMMESGARLFRINFSHGAFDEHLARINMIRMVSKSTRTSVGIIGDLSGPKIRVTNVPGNGIRVRPGQDIVIRSDTETASPQDTPVFGATHPNVTTECEIGHRVLINDGNIRSLCVDKSDREIRCRVTTGGLITSSKGINLPDSDLTVPALTEHDWRCVDFGIEHDVDFFAMSFVRSGKDIVELRDHLTRSCTLETCGLPLDDEHTPRIPIIAKIETPQAVRNIDEILQHTDAIMVARGDLGVEMDIASVPVSQKRLIAAAHRHGKPAIVATQMLESMIESPSPTRAEVSDVANAILDGADCVMLSAETAVGRYPHLAVETMRRVACETEDYWRSLKHENTHPGKGMHSHEIAPAVAHGAYQIAQDIDAKLIACWSERGTSARFLSRNNFESPILAFSSNLKAVRRMNLLYGVFPIWLSEVPEHRSEFAEIVDTMVTARNLIKRGDRIILLGAKPLDLKGSMNTLAVRVAGDLVPEDAVDSFPKPALADANL